MTSTVVAYPALAAVATASNYDIMRWNRFLPSPENDEQVEIIKAVVDRLCAMDPAEKTRVSKAVGWD